jgi:hypothetical protein
MTSPRVLLTTLSVRTSAKGQPYLSGRFGKASVMALEGQPDKHGNPTWNVFLGDPDPQDGPQRPAAGPPERDPAPGRENDPRGAGASPGGPGRLSQRESETARRDRVAGEVATAYGLGENDPDDPLPF